MKIISVDGVLHAVAETVEDAKIIVVLPELMAGCRPDVFVVPSVKVGERKQKKHKKHNHKKVCDRCGKVCKGKMGLGVHMAMAHGVKGIKKTRLEGLKKGPFSCDIQGCTRVFENKLGLGVHKSTIHGVRGPVYEYSRKRYLASRG